MKIGKFLQSLVSQKAQRVQLALSFALSALMLIPLAWQLQLEYSRTQFPQLNEANLNYCELEDCVIQELAGLEVIGVQIVEKNQTTLVEVRFVNHGRLHGNREIYLELLNSAGELSRAAKARLVLGPSGQPSAVFSFEREPELFERGSLRLAF